MTAEDIHAFTPAFTPVTPPPAPMRRPRHAWPWLLAGALLLMLLALACAVAGIAAMADAAHHGLHVVINGEPCDPVVIGTEHGLPAVLGAVAALAVALVVVLLVVPVVVLLALLAAAAGLGIALVAVLAVVAVALSPLWLMGVLLWLLIRPGTRRNPSAAARMAA